MHFLDTRQPRSVGIISPAIRSKVRSCSSFDVDCERLTSHEDRVAKRNGRDQRSNTNSGGLRCERGQERPGFKPWRVWLPEIDEMIGKPDTVKTHCLDGLPPLDYLLPSARRRCEDAEPKLSIHGGLRALKRLRTVQRLSSPEPAVRYSDLLYGAVATAYSLLIGLKNSDRRVRFCSRFVARIRSTDRLN